MGNERASSQPAATGRVAVLLPYPLHGAFDYLVPAGMALMPGEHVAVPLAGRAVPGVVWDASPGAAPAVAREKLKAVLRKFDIPPMPTAMRRFVDWMAAYTVSAPGAVLRMCLRVNAALEPETARLGLRPASGAPARLTPARERVLRIAADGLARTASELAELADVGPSVVHGLRDCGALDVVPLPLPLPPRPDWQRPGARLEPAQQAAATALAERVRTGGFSVALLDGVTGSGKTEVYFEAVAAALAAGRQALVLLPEIALTAGFLQRFAARFGVAPIAWHSELKTAERRRAWRWVAEGEARVVVGARSALFLPFPKLGLVVVDEEHEHAYKQDDGVAYHARDMAIVRAQLAALPVVLVSATPSLETLVNVDADRYARLHLPERFGGAGLPGVEAIDLRREPPPRGAWLSKRLVEALAATLQANEQALLFLNRRGYAPLTLCRACGHRLQCPNCSAWLVEHRFHGRLMCHHCGYDTRLPAACPACGAEDRFAACGPGVERLLEEVRALFPAARAEVVASDTMAGPEAIAQLVGRVERQEIDVIVGTQMVAKGHHFPRLTLVGVVDGDLGLAGGDLRATERTYQLLHQVAGRAGREARPGRVLLQTYMPEHPVMQALIAGDRDGFVAREKAARRTAGMPPFGRLVALIVSSADEAAAARAARALVAAAPGGPGIVVLGPAPAPLSLLRGRFRFRLLLKTPRQTNASELTRRWLAAGRPPGGVRVQVDVDPYTFL
ncbi:MAG: primosomal protein N' [Alphaproteobacteria bacterium]|nr:primosomal protein N' [Alphaproteobacteria bacterium]